MPQEIRNKIYGAVGALGVLAVITGKITQEQADAAMKDFGSVLDQVGLLVTSGTTIFAFFKSLPSRFTTIRIPKSKVSLVQTTDGAVHEAKHAAG